MYITHPIILYYSIIGLRGDHEGDEDVHGPGL